jgi:hypothetical protein
MSRVDDNAIDNSAAANATKASQLVRLNYVPVDN